MARRRRNAPWSSLVTGLAILGCGVIFWLDHMGRIEAWDLLQWWPVAMIAMGLAHLLERQWAGAVVWITLGTLFLLPLLGYRTISVWRLVGIWPLLLSAAGVTLIVQALRPKLGGGSGMQVLAVMGANVRRPRGPEFPGCDAIAVMGACDIDLTSTQVRQEASIDVLAFWGGIGIRVPPGWQVISRATAILGAYTDLTDGGVQGAPRLVLRGSIIMGGVEVRNAEMTT